MAWYVVKHRDSFTLPTDCHIKQAASLFQYCLFKKTGRFFRLSTGVGYRYISSSSSSSCLHELDNSVSVPVSEHRSN